MRAKSATSASVRKSAEHNLSILNLILEYNWEKRVQYVKISKSHSEKDLKHKSVVDPINHTQEATLYTKTLVGWDGIDLLSIMK